MSKPFENWGLATPVYVTRKTADGMTGSLSISIWMQLVALLLIWLNVMVWSCFGLYEAGRLVFG